MTEIIYHASRVVNNYLIINNSAERFRIVFIVGRLVSHETPEAKKVWKSNSDQIQDGRQGSTCNSNLCFRSHSHYRNCRFEIWNSGITRRLML